MFWQTTPPSVPAVIVQESRIEPVVLSMTSVIHVPVPVTAVFVVTSRLVTVPPPAGTGPSRNRNVPRVRVGRYRRWASSAASDSEDEVPDALVGLDVRSGVERRHVTARAAGAGRAASPRTPGSPVAAPARCCPVASSGTPTGDDASLPALGMRRVVLPALFSGGQSAMTDPVPIDYGDRMFEIKSAGLSEDAV